MPDIFGTPNDDVLTGTNDDDLIYGEGGNDTINARGGNDIIYAGAGADTVNGGAGNDEYIIDTDTEFAAGDSFDGGADYDTLRFSVTTSGFLLSSFSYVRVEALISEGGYYALGVTAAQLNAFNYAQGYFRMLGSGAVTASGVTLGNETVFDLAPGITTFSFTAAAGVAAGVNGGDGGVTITGSASNDYLNGGLGNDVLSGGAGTDTLSGNHGTDQLNGGAGDDVLYGGEGDDTLNGGDGNDTIIGEGGNDVLNGDADDDQVYGDAGNDILSGGTGHDSLYGGDGDDSITGGSGDDYLDGGAGNDLLAGGHGSDYLYGGDGDDRLSFYGEGGAFGGADFDRLTIDLSAMTGPTDLDLTAAFNATPPVFGQILAGFEEFTSYTGSAFADRLTLAYGYSGATTINTGAGDDVVFGGYGADTIQLGDGNDYASGSEGDDVIYGGAGNDELNGELGADQLFGGDGDDFLSLFEYGHAPGDTFDGGAGYDSLWVSLDGSGLTFDGIVQTGIERLIAESPFFQLSISAAQIGQFSAAEGNFFISGAGAITLSTVFGGTSTFNNVIAIDQAITAFTFASAAGTSVEVQAGNNGVAITGGAGNDGLIGGFGNDVLNGGSGNDYLADGGYDFTVGFNGNDVLSGGIGNDTLQGGAGLDTLNGGDGDDTINYTYANDGPAGLNDTIIGGAGFDTLMLAQAEGVDGSLGSITVSGIERAYGGGTRATAAELAQFGQIGGEFRISGTGAVAVTGVGLLTATTFTLETGITSFDLSGATYLTEPPSEFGYVPVNVIINGSAGGETITAGNGPNEIRGNGGNDTIYGGTMNDSLEGGAGDDRLYGGAGGDYLVGGEGRDELYGGDGDDGFRPGPDNALVAGEIIDGGAGFDTLYLDDFGQDLGAAYNLTGVTLLGVEALYSFPLFSFLGSAQLQSVQQLQGKFALTDNGSVSLAGITHNGLQIALANGGQSFSLAGSTGNYYNNTGVKVFGGNGNDTITAGAIRGDYFGGAGNDTFVLAASGTVDGGTGYDTAVVNGSTDGFGFTDVELVQINSGGNLAITPFDYSGLVDDGTVVSGTGTISVYLNNTNTEFAASGLAVAAGSTLRMVIHGSWDYSDAIKGHRDMANTIYGRDGDDSLRGGQLADVIDGGYGDDKIEGGRGADILTGGWGADTFRYQSTQASGLGAAADRITDFMIGSDRLGFALIDADALTPGDQAFAFLGTAAFANTGVGQIRYATSGANLLVQVDSDGNGVADMEIVLEGLAGQTLTGSSFLL